MSGFWNLFFSSLSSVFLAIIYQSLSQEFLSITDHQYEGYALTHTTYKELRSDSYASCLFECHQDVKCMSINYNILQQLCQMNSQNKDSLPNKFVEKVNYIYATSLEDRKPERIPWGHWLRPARSCLHIVNSGDSFGTKKYWLHIPDTQFAIKGYCLMHIDGGGWTIISRTVLAAPSLPPQTSRFNKYNMISHFNRTDTIVRPTSTGMMDIKNKIGFNQIYFYCYKKSVGKTISLMTTNDAKGRDVLRYFTDDAYAADYFPDSCDSFTKFDKDDSKLGDDCDKWGKDRAGNTEIGKWGYSPITTLADRILEIPMYLDDQRCFGGEFGSENKLYCDDCFSKYDSEYNIGDTWIMAVR